MALAGWTLALFACALLAGCGGDGGDASDRPGGPPGGRRGKWAKGKQPPGSQEESRVPVIVTTATRGDMEAFLEASSTLEAEAFVEVVSEATGVVAMIAAEEGDHLRAGETLARMDYEELELAERRAASEQDRLRADFARAERLVRDQLIPEGDFQTVEFDLARAEIDWQQAALELKRTRIVAPISGTITQRMINVGDLVQKNQAVYRIVDFNSLVAPVHIPEKHLVDLHVGQQAVLQPPALSGREIAARIKRISPVVNSQSGTVEVILAMDRPTSLRPGMFANARIVLDRHADVVVLPKKTLVYEDEQPHVFVVEEGRARKRRVELGYQDSARAEVTSGLDEGVLVVLVGQSTLKEGSPVSAEDSEGTPIPLGVDDDASAAATAAADEDVPASPRGERAARGKRP